MFLTREEIEELTHMKRPVTQMRALREMGIPHFARPDGTLAVLRQAVEVAFGLKPDKSRATSKKSNIRWDLVK